MDRFELAYRYHQAGYNCAQSVVGAFLDRLSLTKDQAMAACCGFGGGVGGSREELCGAASGGVMVLSLLNPHIDGADKDGKQRIYDLAKEFRRRFADAFGGLTRCGALLEAAPAAGEKTPAAARMGLASFCDVAIVTAVEIVEQLLTEQENQSV